MNQSDYILLLFNDCGLDTHSQRAAFMTREFERPVKYADELYPFERSLLINALKDLKDSKRPSESWKDDEGRRKSMRHTREK